VNYRFIPNNASRSAALLAGDVDFIDFDRSFEHSGYWLALHRFADSTGQEPSRPVGTKAQHALQLQSRYTLFAGAHEVECLGPRRQGQVRIFHNRFNRDGELFAAGVALERTGPRCLALQSGGLVLYATVGAYRPIGPAQAFKVGPRLILAVIDDVLTLLAFPGDLRRVVISARHEGIIPLVACFVKCIIPVRNFYCWWGLGLRPFFRRFLEN